MSRLTVAHRVSYQMDKGEVPSGLQLDHLCRVRCCVNPDHLEPVSQKENVRRGFAFRRVSGGWVGPGFCSKGHDLSGRGTYRRPKTGKAVCRVCKMIETVRSNKKRLAEKRQLAAALADAEA